MNRPYINYCRLETLHWLGFQSNSNHSDKSIGWGDKTTIYAENFGNITSLKERIKEQSQKWIDSAKTNKDDNNLENSEKISNYPNFIIYNSSYALEYIGVTPNGWFAPSEKFYMYMLRYFIKIYGEYEYSEHIDRGESIEFIGAEGDCWIKDSVELVSEKLLDILLLDFLEKKKVSQEALKKACYQEMMDRGYISD